MSRVETELVGEGVLGITEAGNADDITETEERMRYGPGQAFSSDFQGYIVENRHSEGKQE